MLTIHKALTEIVKVWHPPKLHYIGVQEPELTDKDPILKIRHLFSIESRPGFLTHEFFLFLMWKVSEDCRTIDMVDDAIRERLWLGQAQLKTILKVLSEGPFRLTSSPNRQNQFRPYVSLISENNYACISVRAFLDEACKDTGTIFLDYNQLLTNLNANNDSPKSIAFG